MIKYIVFQKCKHPSDPSSTMFERIAEFSTKNEAETYAQSLPYSVFISEEFQHDDDDDSNPWGSGYFWL